MHTTASVHPTGVTYKLVREPTYWYSLRARTAFTGVA